MLLITFSKAPVVKFDCSTRLDARIKRIEKQEWVENLA
jgi:hypothetical protein